MDRGRSRPLVIRGKESKRCNVAGFEYRGRRPATAKECGQPLKAGKGTKMDLAKRVQDGTEPCGHCKFIPGRPMSDF